MALFFPLVFRFLLAFLMVIPIRAFLSFDGNSVVDVEMVRFPINQINPARHTDFNPDGNGIYDYLVSSRYCLHYPDFMCYERPGNGWTPGDDGLWLIISDTDYSGLGSIRLDFPKAYDELVFPGQDKVNGLHSPHVFKPAIGLTVFITSFSADLRFEPSLHMVYIADVPIEFWDQPLYVGFSASPSSSHWFAVYRRVVYHAESYDPRRPNDPAPTHTHDEL